MERVDHLVYSAPDLQRGIAQVEARLGVRATQGGQHPGRGTRNALIALGPATYLEIIGPDPEQPAPQAPRVFRIDELQAPQLVTWAAKAHDLEQMVRKAERQGITLGVVSAGSRQRPDGVRLAWRYTNPRTVLADGLVPFFIDWGQTPHPAQGAAPGATLVELRAEHPEPTRVQSLLARLGIALRVTSGAGPALIATIDGPRGRVELR
jgi:hypothetical protein